MGNACAGGDGYTATTAARGARHSKDEIARLGERGHQILEQAEAEISEAIVAQRIVMGKFINSEPPSDPDARLLRIAASAVVFSATEENFEFFATAPDAAVKLNDLSIQMSPASMNFGCTALTIIIGLSAEIRDAGVGIHNTPISDAQLLRALKLKAMWKKMLDAHSIRNYVHPRLGRVPVVQPVIHTCIQWRGAGCGNGEGSDPDPLIQYLLDHGARANIRNSLGLTAMHAVVEACERLGSMGLEDERDLEKLAQTLEVARILARSGALVLDDALPMTGDTSELIRCGTGLEKMVGQGKTLNALESCRRMRTGAREGNKAHEALAEVLAELAAKERVACTEAEQSPEVAMLMKAGIAVHGAPSGWVDRSTHPLQPELPAPSWVQAIFNTLWLVQLITSQDTAAKRRALLTELARTAPFQMPLMTAVPYVTLKRLGRLPKRDTSVSDDERGWRGPVPVSMLPDDAVVVFLSHRWLRPGNPDDENGTKFRQITEVMELLAKELGQDCGGAHKLYLWADYSCIDQCNPFPGVQMLPAYVSCCDEFAYVVHPEYDNRAWCRTEQFMHWRLKCHSRKWRLEDGRVVDEPPGPCPDPATGELYSEEDRVALVNMTSLFDDVMSG